MYFKALLPVISDFNSTMSVSKLKFSGWFRGLLCLDIFYKYILIYTTIPSILGLYNYILDMDKYIYIYIICIYIHLYRPYNFMHRYFMDSVHCIRVLGV